MKMLTYRLKYILFYQPTCGGLWPSALSNVKTLSDLIQFLLSWGNRLNASLNSATCSSVKLSWTSSFENSDFLAIFENFQCRLFDDLTTGAEDSALHHPRDHQGLLLQKIACARALNGHCKVAIVSTHRNMGSVQVRAFST